VALALSPADWRRGGACEVVGAGAGADEAVPLGDGAGFVAPADAGLEAGFGEGFEADRQADTSNTLAMATSR
jgi:hypothetical protein